MINNLTTSGVGWCLSPSGPLALQVINTTQLLQLLNLFITSKNHDICSIFAFDFVQCNSMPLDWHQGCARFAQISLSARYCGVEFWPKKFEFQILWSLSWVDVHTLILQLPIQTQNSVAPELQDFVSSLEILAKRAHPIVYSPCSYQQCLLCGTVKGGTHSVKVKYSGYRFRRLSLVLLKGTCGQLVFRGPRNYTPLCI